MRRLTWRDWIPLALLGPLWLLAFGLHVERVLGEGVGWVPLYVAASPDPGPPRVTGFFPGAGPETRGTLEVGDRLLEIGGRDLAGAGPVSFVLLAYARADRGPAVVRYRRGEITRETEIALQPLAHAWRTLPLTLGLGALALVVLLRGGGSATARALTWAAGVYSLNWLLFPGGPIWRSALSLGLLVGSAAFTEVLALRVLQRLPPDATPQSWLGRSWPWIFVASAPGNLAWVFGWPLSGETGMQIAMLSNVAFLGAGLVVLGRNYRGADLVGRRQLKWVALGIYLAFAPVLVTSVVILLRPALVWLYDVSLIATLALPICTAIALIWYRFLDVDRVLDATTTYSILSILLLAGLLFVAPSAAATVGDVAGLDAEVSQVILSVVLAALVVPAQRSLAPRVQRVIFRDRHRVQEGLHQLRRALEGRLEPEKVFQLLGERLEALLLPDCVAIYARAGESFAPVFARGPSVAPAFASRGGLAALLDAEAAPIDAVRWRRWVRSGAISEADAAALESLAAEVVVPVLSEQSLAAFICLGSKRSGDIYTATELAWLTVLAERVASQLAHFDDQEVVRQSRELQNALRSYVPGAVAQELARGDPVAPREREVTVLFVDIRGYSGYAEGKLPEEIFSTINRYTEVVSSAVMARGGTVVEFNGDGMMVVFGAPQELAGKESAAIEAAIDIARAVPALEIAGPDGAPLSVGVGVATGSAFVGSIHSADRLIWSAIGNTTNLAARLQALTRDLEVSLIVDAATHAVGGSPQHAFEAHTDVRIRGRERREQVYALRV